MKKMTVHQAVLAIRNLTFEEINEMTEMAHLQCSQGPYSSEHLIKKGYFNEEVSDIFDKHLTSEANEQYMEWLIQTVGNFYHSEKLRSEYGVTEEEWAEYDDNAKDEVAHECIDNDWVSLVIDNGIKEYVYKNVW